MLKKNTVDGSVSRRKTQPKEDAELYSLPKTSIKEFIKKERRHDELGRLREVRIQKIMWCRIIVFAVLLNLGLMILAIIGIVK